MIGIYFYETPEGSAEAIAAAMKLRGLGKKVRMSNASYFEKTQLERLDAVVALGCPHVAEAYEERNRAIELAAQYGDVRKFAGITVAKVVSHAEDLIESVEEDPDADVDGDELGKMTRDMLADYALSMLGIHLPANMRKSEMVKTIREGISKQTPVAPVDGEAA